MNKVFSVTDRKWVDADAHLTTHFTYGELADPLEKIVFIDMIFMRDMVEPLRVAVGVPFQVNSACRSTATNNRVKGHPRSLHLMFNQATGHNTGTLALDISSVKWDDVTKREFVKQAHKLGLSVGTHPTFYHIDGRILIGKSQATFKY